jgi:spore coat polysaccharide biosynthesis protein SpsF
VAIIVQARMASTRLPGKVLERLAGETVLAHVLRRCAAVPGGDVVCCAIPVSAGCDAVAEAAAACGAQVFRGSENDVLDRYHGAAQACEADLVMRVTSDCPLIDPVVCGSLLQLFKDQGVDYASNNVPRGWPHGLDCEVFSAAALARAAGEAKSPDEREHVTPWLRSHPDIRRATLDGPGGDLSDMRWTLDYPEDLAFFQALFDLIPPSAGFEDIVTLLRAHPEIAAINAERRIRRCA